MNENDANINKAKPADNLPEWLEQFKKELNDNKPQAKNSEKQATNTQQPKVSHSDFQNAESILMNATGGPQLVASDYHPFAFMELAGYENCIKRLKYLGIGASEKDKSSGIVSALNKFHGLKSRPALKPIIFIGESDEEINPILEATAQQLSCATIRMSVQDSPAGMPAILAQANKTAMQVSHGKPPLVWLSENNGLLILENLEDWGPFFDGQSIEFGDGVKSFISIQLSPAGKEFLNMVEICSENPNVQILCSTTYAEDVPPRMMEILGDVSEVKVEKPTSEERRQIWNKLANTHPSLRGQNFEELSSLTEHLTRAQIEKVVQEAIAESYNSGLKFGKCDRIKRENLFEKILLKQDKNSKEFKKIEDVLVEDFAHQFDFNQVITH